LKELSAKIVLIPPISATVGVRGSTCFLGKSEKGAKNDQTDIYAFSKLENRLTGGSRISEGWLAVCPYHHHHHHHHHHHREALVDRCVTPLWARWIQAF